MRISFLLPFTAFSGAIIATCHLADGLSELGHEVVVIYRHNPATALSGWEMDGARGVARFAKRQVLFSLGRREPFWSDLKTRVVGVSEWADTLLPKSDIIIGNDWTTAEFLSSLSPSRGVPVFLIHGYDIFNADSNRLEAAWRLPIAKIAVSTFLQSLARDRFQVEVMGPLTLGVDQGVFFNPRGLPNPPRRIGMLYHTMPNKGVADGLRAFELAREKFPNIQLVMYGADKPNPPLPHGVEYHRRPRGERLRRIYSGCGIWLVPSWQEGCHMPPMEAMACGCAVAATDVGGIRDYAIPGETVLISPPRQPDALARNLIRLLEDATERARIAGAGTRKIREFTWERSARLLEEYLLEVA